jgi:hypothetical protein
VPSNPRCLLTERAVIPSRSRPRRNVATSAVVIFAIRRSPRACMMRPALRPGPRR